MASSTTVSLPVPSPRRGLGWRESIQRLLTHDWTLGYLFLLPALLVIVGLVAYPFASAIVMTFQAKTAGTPGRFIGLDNYRELLQSEQFLRTVVNTVVYTAVGVGVKFLLGLSMALVLNQERFCNNLFRSFLLIPWAIPTVMSALNWRWIFDDASGLINNVLVRLNLIGGWCAVPMRRARRSWSYGIRPLWRRRSTRSCRSSAMPTPSRQGSRRARSTIRSSAVPS